MGFSYHDNNLLSSVSGTKCNAHSATSEGPGMLRTSFLVSESIILRTNDGMAWHCNNNIFE